MYNRDGRRPGGGDVNIQINNYNRFGRDLWWTPQWNRPWNFWTGGWNDPFGGLWKAGCYWTTLMWYGRRSGGALGCGNFIWDGGSCPPCTYPCGGTQWVPNCCPISQYQGWTGTCFESSCDNCFYFDPTYNACVAAPQCGQ